MIVEAYANGCGIGSFRILVTRTEARVKSARKASCRDWTSSILFSDTHVVIEAIGYRVDLLQPVFLCSCKSRKAPAFGWTVK